MANDKIVKVDPAQHLDARSWKPALLVDGVWSYNAQRFATYAEARASAHDRFCRWTMPSDFDAHPSDDPVTYHRLDGDDVYGSDRPTERVAMLADGIGKMVHTWASWVAAYRAEREPPSFVVPWERDVAVADLPPHVRSAILRAGYTLRTVPMFVAHDKIMVSSVCSDGSRVTVVTCARKSEPTTCPTTGTTVYPAAGDSVWTNVTEVGSWGGPNPFEQSTIDAMPVRKIPDGGCIVTATTARSRKSPWVTVYARAIDALAWLATGPEAEYARDHLVVARDCALEGKHEAAREIATQGLAELPKASDGLTEIQREILRVYKGIKSAYRKRELERVASASDVAIALESLVADGYLKRAKNGATSVTDKGKSAARD